MVLPERKLERMEQFLERFPDVQEVIVDGTERPVQRPQAKEKRKQHYSGKKKRFTRKHITGSTRKKRIILLTKARPGRIHPTFRTSNWHIEYFNEAIGFPEVADRALSQ